MRKPLSVALVVGLLLGGWFSAVPSAQPYTAQITRALRAFGINGTPGTFTIPVNGVASGTCVTPSFTFTGNTNTGVGYLGANNGAGCANGATIFDWNASRVLFGQPIYAADGTASAPSIALGSQPGLGIYKRATDYLAVGDGTFIPLFFGGLTSGTESGMFVSATGAFGFSSSANDASASTDLYLRRDAANILAQRNGTNAQTFRVYGNATGSKYLTLSHDGTNGIISTSSGPLYLRSSVGWLVASSGTAGDLIAENDNSYDFGRLGANRARTGYFGTSVVSPVVNATTGYQVGGINQIVNVASNFTTANNTNLQTITGLTWQLPASTALNMPFSCKLEWSQATAAVAVSFGLQTDTVTPSNFLGLGQMETNLTVTSYGDVAIANTTATVVVTGTPAATATTYNAYIDGFIENPSNGSATNVNVMVKTATGADAVTVYRGSYCRAF